MNSVKLINRLKLNKRNISLLNNGCFKSFSSGTTNSNTQQQQQLQLNQKQQQHNDKFEEQKKVVKETLENPQGSKFLKGDILLEGIRNDGSSIRWYKNANVSKVEDGVDVVGNNIGYYPLIDDRKMKTPGNNVIVAPSKEIAYSIAAEWLAQEKYIRPSRLPITQTIITCMDIRPEGRKKIIGEFLNHLATDPICNREQNDSKLKSLQTELYDPVLEFANQYYGIPFTLSKHLSISHHSKELLNKIEKHLNLMNNWELVCLQLISQSSKSYLVALSLYYGKLRLDNFYKTIALEEEYQSETWGKIPFGHDLAECETHNEVAPPLFILRNMKPIPLPK